MFRRVALLAGGILFLHTAPLCAQNAILAQRYGSGVHAYFAQDYLQAYELFNSAITAGSLSLIHI